MAGSQPTHANAAMYHVVLHAVDGRALFTRLEHRLRFESILTRALEGCRAKLHAYAWLEPSAHLLLQVQDVRIALVMQRICHPYSRYINGNEGAHGAVFRSPYRQSDVTSAKQMLRLVGEIHALHSVHAGGGWSSESAYLGKPRISALSMDLVIGEANRQRSAARDTRDEQFVSRLQGPLISVAAIEPAAGDAGSSAEAPGVSKDQIIWDAHGLGVATTEDAILKVATAVSIALDVTVDELRSTSRRRRLSRARVLTAWHVTRNGIATLAQMSAWVHRDPSTMSLGIEQYRLNNPELFFISFEQLLHGPKTLSRRDYLTGRGALLSPAHGDSIAGESPLRPDSTHEGGDLN